MGFTDRPQVMVVGNDPAMCNAYRTLLGSRGYDALTLTRADDAIGRFRLERPMAVLLDLAVPGIVDGLATLAAFKRIDRDVPIIVLSHETHTRTVVQAMKLGATDFLCKPFNDADLEILLSSAVEQRQLLQEVAWLRDQLNRETATTTPLGNSDAMNDVHELIELVADTDVRVLLRGERGSGKETVARAVHERSRRSDKPFVTVNCADFHAELLESELFGFENRVFTGAIRHKPGRFELADHGTIFLDEIGEMSLPLQAKLLQVLQDGEFSRLGGKSKVRVDVRVIAATPRDLQAAIAQGRFREDLYFRLNVVTIDLPRFADRFEEIPEPVGDSWPDNVLVARASLPLVLPSRAAAPQPALPPPAAALSPYTSASRLAATSAPDVAVAWSSGNLSLKEIARKAAQDAERVLIQRVLTRTRWNRKEAAEILGISYKALLYKIKENGLDRAS